MLGDDILGFCFCKRYAAFLLFPGFGFKGDIVRVSKRLARNHMLPVGVAEYLCPENVAKYEQVRKV
jgi:ribosomal protein L9